MMRFRRQGPGALAATVATLVALLLIAGCGKSDAQLADEALQKGLFAHQAGDLATAAQEYREVLRYDPQNKYAYYNLGLIDQTNGDLSSAENNYRIALSFDPIFAAALFNLAIIRTELGARDEAAELYRQVIAVEPENAGAHLNLGHLLIAMGQEEEGQAEILLAHQLDPSIGAPPSTPVPEASPSASP